MGFMWSTENWIFLIVNDLSIRKMMKLTITLLINSYDLLMHLIALQTDKHINSENNSEKAHFSIIC